jgi:predicted RNA-binding Zn-ribbon protein involved in translation (DUF1610 family)
MEAVDCPGCGRELAINHEQIGSTIQCPHCGTRFRPVAASSELWQPTQASASLGQKSLPGKYCQGCGTSIRYEAVICPNCGVQQPEPVVYRGEYGMSNSKGESAGGKVCSVLSVIFGCIAFLFCPPLFGLAGLTLGIVGVVLSRNKAIAVVGIVMSVLGTFIGMLIGAAIALASQ